MSSMDERVHVLHRLQSEQYDPSVSNYDHPPTREKLRRYADVAARYFGLPGHEAICPPTDRASAYAAYAFLRMTDQPNLSPAVETEIAALVAADDLPQARKDAHDWAANVLRVGVTRTVKRCRHRSV